MLSVGDKQRKHFELVCTKLGPRILEDKTHAAVFGECKRSNEQATINALGKDGRDELARILEASGDPRFHALALAILDNGKANGILLSVHLKKLATDIDLFKRNAAGLWEYQPTTEAHQPFGVFWESLSVEGEFECCWGGRWGDGNHYSIRDGAQR